MAIQEPSRHPLTPAVGVTEPEERGASGASEEVPSQSCSAIEWDGRPW
jgi:hypothetical protein